MSHGRCLFFGPLVSCVFYSLFPAGAAQAATSLPQASDGDVATNGACGSANGAAVSSQPTSGLCLTGLASPVTGSGPWEWACAGSNGGTSANCSAPFGISGQCGAANGVTVAVEPMANLCAAGTVASAMPNGLSASVPAIVGIYPGTGWSWSCVGTNGASSATCSAARATVDAAHTLYVAATGRDVSGCGTISRPCATLAFASNGKGRGYLWACYNNKNCAIGKLGTVDIVVRGGTYGHTSVNNNAWNGTANVPRMDYIRVYPYPGEAAIIDGAGMDGIHNLVGLSSYVEFGGFEVRNLPVPASTWPCHQCSKAGIIAWSEHNVQIVNNTIHDIAGPGILLGGGGSTPSASSNHDNLIQGNTVFHVSQDNGPPVVDPAASMDNRTWEPAIAGSWIANSIVAGNYAHDNYGEGIGYYLAYDLVISGNTVANSYGPNIYVDNYQNSTVSGNFVYYTGAYDHPVQWPHSGLTGIQIARECYEGGRPVSPPPAPSCITIEPPLSGNKIVNNIVAGFQYGIRYQDYAAAGGMQNTLIANNTFVNQTTAAIEIGVDNPAWDTFSSNVVENNVFYGAEPLFSSYGTLPASGITFNNNVWYNNFSSTWPVGSASDVVADPQFAGSGVTPVIPSLTSAPYLPAAHYEAGNYTLPAASPAKSSGHAEPQVTVDFSGKSRVAPFSIGAFQ
jgi:hypothetical protein